MLGDVAEPTALSELRQILASLPQKPGASANEFVKKMKEDESWKALKKLRRKSRSSFFQEVRQNLCRLPEQAQKELVELFSELKNEVVKLLDAMAQAASLRKA